MGDAPDQVETAALKILFAEKDGTYIKALFSWTCEYEGCPRGLFLPARGWLVTSPASYKALLKQHNNYLNTNTVIALEGLHPNVLDKEIAVSNKNVSVQDYLIKQPKVIESMECTNLSNEKGKWEIQALYQRVVPSGLRFDAMPIPRCTNSRAQRMMGSYTAVLLSCANPRDDASTHPDT
eukprot:11626580-Ditylum_brightwellii.AAC.1